MEIHNLKISDLIKAEYNPRKLSAEQYEHIKSSLMRFGVVDPVIVNSNPERKNIIIGGHQRTKVWKDLGNDEIPVYYIDLPLEKEKELNIRLNKNTGEFDLDLLNEFFEKDDLLDWGFEESVFLNIEDFEESFTLPDGDKEPFQQMTFTLADEQAEQIKSKIDEVKKTDHFKYIETFGNENGNGNALYALIMSV